MQRQDILLDANDDLVIQGGDFRIGPSDLQHVYHIIRLPKGAWKQYPLTGVGEARFLNAPLDASLRRDIQLQLQADGYRMRSVAFRGNTLDVQFDPPTS
jgi:hypothetical protein